MRDGIIWSGNVTEKLAMKAVSLQPERQGRQGRQSFDLGDDMSVDICVPINMAMNISIKMPISIENIVIKRRIERTLD